MSPKDCMYCDNVEKLESLMIFVADLGVSKLYLLKEQTYYGRCVVAYKEHDVELFALSSDELSRFMDDVTQVGLAIHKAVSPDKVNYGFYGDTMPHLHAHVVPKVKGGHTFGSPFEMSVDPPKFLTEDEYASLIQSIKSNL